MKLNRLKRVLSAIIAYALVLTLSIPALAADVANFTDLPDKSHYTYAGIIDAINNDIMIGDGTGRFMPNEIMTRVAAATYLVRVMGASVRADVTNIKDYERGKWYDNEGSLAIAIHMGLVDVVNGMAYPNDTITREEAFEMMARAVNVNDGTFDDISWFADAGNVDAKYVTSVASLVKGGYVKGTTQGTNAVIDPKGVITRGDFATLFGRVFANYISTPDVYSNTLYGNAIVRTGDVTLKNLNVKGDLIIGEGAANGTVTLDGVSVDGRILLRSGNVAVDGEVNNLVVASNSVNLSLLANAKVDSLTILDDNVTVNTSLGSEINTLYVNGKNAAVKGYVSIETAYVSDSGTVIESAPAKSVVPDKLTANIAGSSVSGTTTSTANRPTLTLTLGNSGTNNFTNLSALYSETTKLAPTNHLIIEINSIPDDILVVDYVNFPGSNYVTIKADSGLKTPFPYGVVINKSNVTLDGLNFFITDTRNIPIINNRANVIATGINKTDDDYSTYIENTTIRNCNIVFDNYGAGMHVSGVYFDSYTSDNTIIGGSIDVSGQSLPFDSVGVYAVSVSLIDTIVKSNDLALLVSGTDLSSDIIISGSTRFYSSADVAVQFSIDKSNSTISELAFGSAFGGYNNVRAGEAKSLIDSIIGTYIVTDVANGYVANGVKVKDYYSSLTERYYKDEFGFVWSQFHNSSNWSYCNMPVNGMFNAGNMYMLVDVNDVDFTSGNTRYVKSNGTLSDQSTDMNPLTTAKNMISNMPALNDYVTYKIVAMSPFIGEVKGLVASLTSVPYAIDNYIAANGTETGANDNAARAGNLNSARSGRFNLYIDSDADKQIFLYLNLSRVSIGSQLAAWNFVDGVENSITLIEDANTDINPLADSRFRIQLDTYPASNTIIIKGNDGNFLFIKVMVSEI